MGGLLNKLFHLVPFWSIDYELLLLSVKIISVGENNISSSIIAVIYNSSSAELLFPVQLYRIYVIYI